MTTLSFLLLGAACGCALARALRIPLIPVLIALGMLLPTVGIRGDVGELRYIFELGLVFLVFVVGTEFAPDRLQGRIQAVLWVGMGQFVFMGAAGVLLCLLMGLDGLTSVYVGLALSASSTLVVVRQLKGSQQMFEPFGRLVTGVLFLQDLLVIVGIVGLVRFAEGPRPWLLGIGELALLLAAALVCRRWIMPWLVLRGKLGEEERLIVVLAQLFVFIGSAHLLDLPLVAGAFLAGFGLSSFPLNSVARGLLWPLSEFFMAIFFISLGAVIRWPTGDDLLLALVLALFVLVLTPPLVTFLAERQGMSARASIESGLLLAQTSEFSLVIALHGMIMGVIAPEIFSIIGVVTVVTMMLTPLIATDGLTWSLLRLHPSRRARSERLELDGHVLLLGFGSAASRLLKPLREAGREVIVVDEDAIVISRLSEEGVPCLRGDASDPDVLRRVRARRARCIICSLRRQRDAENVLAYVEESRPKTLVRVFDEEAAERVRAYGGTPIESAKAATECFMLWYEAKFAEKASR